MISRHKHVIKIVNHIKLTNHFLIIIVELIIFKIFILLCIKCKVRRSFEFIFKDGPGDKWLVSVEWDFLQNFKPMAMKMSDTGIN